jgi:hypothetical protein
MSHTGGVRPNRVLAIVVGSIALVALVAAVLAATRSEPEFDPATPEGTVQGYLRAVFQEDEDQALTYLAADTECDRNDFQGVFTSDSARVVLRSVETEGAEASVEVEIAYTGGQGPFDTYEWSEDQAFELERVGDRWVLVGEPWPLYFCREG